MTTATSSEPFELIRAFLEGETVDLDSALPPPIERLLTALQREVPCGPRDLAVLFRHVLRQSGGTLRVPDDPGFPSEADWDAVGVRAIRRDDGWSVSAAPWTPDWLPDVPVEGVDDATARGELRRRERTAPADPLLQTFDYPSYQSTGQRTALRAALRAPAGSTLVASLPTGEGKSLLFHALARLGFGDGPGVTLVVTPTVALSLDHEQSARALGFDQMPMAYRAGEDLQIGLLQERIRDGSQSLCFASPEAIRTTLRQPLRDAAKAGRLTAIVVDEAHLIDSWGINFRPDFQLLAGLRRQLLDDAGDRPFRTLLLSATLTDDNVRMLRTLFPGDPFRVVSGARLRPEIDYWVADQTDVATREERVLDAVHHLPRPAIVYTTTRKDANNWYRSLRNLGFQRLGKVTGASSDHERQQVVDGWRSGEIDLVVATSAFGLGIDNQHVRAVVHACIPESLDRFYQEVGRGGRDGHASVSLLVPAAVDGTIAKRIARQHLLKPDTARRRWNGMFNHRDYRYADGMHQVPVNRRPSVSPEDIDMVGPTNTLWNLRTLVLMSAAGALALRDVPHRLVERLSGTADEIEDSSAPGDGEEDSIQELVTLELLDQTHPSPEFWSGRIADFRHAQDVSGQARYTAMERFREGAQCAAELIAPLYEFSGDPEAQLPSISVGRACGGCPACRRDGRAPFEQPMIDSGYPWSPPPSSAPVAALLSESGHLLVEIERRATGALDRDRERRALRRVVAAGVRNVILLPDAPFTLEDFEEAAGESLFLSDHLLMSGLPPGPTVIALAPSTRIAEADFAPRAPGDERIWLVPQSVPHPTRPASTLLDVPPNGRAIRLEEFVSVMLR